MSIETPEASGSADVEPAHWKRNVGIFISGEPGPIAPAGMVLSHFQLPSMVFIIASHSGDPLT